MSIKFYQGWRWPKGLGIFSMVEKIRTEAKKKITHKLRELVRELKIQDNKHARLEIAGMLSTHTRLATTDFRINPYDIDIVFNLRETPTHYLCASTIYRIDLDFMNDIEGLENFSYWSDCDKPEEVSHEEWKERGQIWEECCKPENPSIYFSALDLLNPGIEICKIVVPESMTGKLPENYWED